MLNEHERQLIHAAVTKFPTAKALNLSNNGMSLRRFFTRVHVSSAQQKLRVYVQVCKV
jgi:hypothetical protein